MIVVSSDSALSVIVVETSVKSFDVGHIILAGGFSFDRLTLQSIVTSVLLGGHIVSSLDFSDSVSLPPNSIL